MSEQYGKSQSQVMSDQVRTELDKNELILGSPVLISLDQLGLISQPGPVGPSTQSVIAERDQGQAPIAAEGRTRFSQAQDQSGEACVRTSGAAQVWGSDRSGPVVAKARARVQFL